MKNKLFKKLRRKASAAMTGALVFAASINMAYAAEQNALTAINNLSTLISSIVSAFGGIILLFGCIQLGMGFKKQDPASKAEGIGAIIGGLIVACAPWIIKEITG